VSKQARFDAGGRLHGGFWIGLKSSRRRHIRIDGEPVVLLDFRSMSPRLAYAQKGLEPPEGDLYDVSDRIPVYDPLNEDHRDVVKKGLNALLNGAKRLTSKEILEGLREMGVWPFQLKNALEIKHLWIVIGRKKDFGLRLQLTESRIMIGVLERLSADG